MIGTRHVPGDRVRASSNMAVWVLTLLMLAVSSTAGATEHAFVLSTDYFSAAYYSTIEIQPPRTTEINLATCWLDPVAHYDTNEHMIFIVNRYGNDNIQIVDPDQDFATVHQYSVGNGSNPHCIRLASSAKAYVSRYEMTTMLVVDPYSGDSLGVIDLASFADADGIPEMDWMEIVENRLFVTLNYLDRSTWQPAGPGRIVVIDTGTDTLVDCDPDSAGIQPIILDIANPSGKLRYDLCRQKLIVACAGRWGALDGGLQAIDPFRLETTRVITTDSLAGGDIRDAVLGPGYYGYAVVENVGSHALGRFVKFETVTGAVIDTLYEQTSGSYSALGDLGLNRQGEIYLCDRDWTQPGIRIYDTLADTLAARIDVGVPPCDVAFVQVPSAGVAEDDRDRSGDCVLYRNHPNPFGTDTEIAFSLAADADVELSVYDVQGRLVSELARGRYAAGRHACRWDGCDRSGRSLASGVYFCRLRLNDTLSTRRMVLIR